MSKPTTARNLSSLRVDPNTSYVLGQMSYHSHVPVRLIVDVVCELAIASLEDATKGLRARDETPTPAHGYSETVAVTAAVLERLVDCCRRVRTSAGSVFVETFQLVRRDLERLKAPPYTRISSVASGIALAQREAAASAAEVGA